MTATAELNARLDRLADRPVDPARRVRVRGLESGRTGTFSGWYLTDAVAWIVWDGGPRQRVGVRNFDVIS